MAERSASSSEQYTKKSNRLILFAGLVLLILSTMAYCAMTGGQKRQVVVSTPINPEVELPPHMQGMGGDGIGFNAADANLVAQPESVLMTGVVLGSKAESIVTLTAKEAPVRFLGMELAEQQDNGFTFEGTCQPNVVIQKDSSCTIKVLWSPTELRQIQNTLNIRWEVDDVSVFGQNVLSLSLSAQSTDSKDCVICETKCDDKEKAKERLASLFDGRTGVVDGDRVIIDGKEYIVRDGLLIDPETGAIVGIVEPERIPLSLDNKLMGTISPQQDVLSADGNLLGRLVGDDTIVDSSLKVLGAAVPVVSVMDKQGKVIGKTLNDGTVVDGSGSVIGHPMVDGSVSGLDGTQIGYLRPYGLVIGFTGEVLGGVVHDGTVINGNQQVIGSVKPNGVAVNPDGEIMGGIVPRGIGTGTGCQSIGTIMPNGQVKNNFEQVVGKVLLDGSIIDEKNAEIGSVVSQGMVINEKGEIIGFVNSEGKAVDSKGSIIGCLNADGTVAAGKKIIGAVMPKGFVVGRGCQVIGSVYPNGVVMNASVAVVGQVRPDSYVINMNNRIIGAVVPRGSAIADGCRLLGLIALDGDVVDTTGLVIGCVTMDKEVVDKNNEKIGFVAPRGVVVDKAGKIIGRVRLDGKVIDMTGKIIGCVNEDGTVVALDGKTIIGEVVGGGVGGVGGIGGGAAGVILDANGNPTGWTVVGNKVYDENGNLIGELLPNGWVVNEKGEIIGVIPPDGVIFSHDGLVLGRYTSKTGSALTMAGDKLGVVLPDYSVLNMEKTIIIGALVPDKTAFMDTAGNYLGAMDIEGLLMGSAGESLGVIKADGTVINRSGQVVGIKIPQGKVLSVLGNEVGTVSPKGEVMSPARTVIGKVTGNGIALSNGGQILGGVFPDISLPMGAEGVLGAMTYQGTVNNEKGRQIAKFSPFGTVFGKKENITGRLVRIGPYVDASGKLIGWSDFKGSVNNKEGFSIGTMTVTGLALDTNNNVIGSIVPRGTVVGVDGAYLGMVSPNGQVLSADGKTVGMVGASEYLFNEANEIIARILPAGIAIDADGGVLGWSRFDGSVEDGAAVIGTVGLNNRLMNATGDVLGMFLPLATPAVNNKHEYFGLVSENGSLVDENGGRIGSLINDIFVVDEGKTTGRLMTSTFAVNDNLNGKLWAMTGADGTVMGVNDNKPVGQLMTNGLVSDLTKKVVGGLAPVGLPIGTRLTALGKATAVGQVSVAGQVKAFGLGTGNGAVYQADGQIVGGIMPAGTFIDRNGAFIGRSSGTSVILDKTGKKLGAYMPFGSALTPDNIWAGGAMPMGMAINDDGYDIGVVALDGVIVGKDGSVMGRILSDGTAVGVSDKSLFTTMPYAGHTVKQGLPFGYKNVVLGRTTINGDIIDAADKKAYRALDDGTILGKEMPLDGAVLSFNPATSHQGDLLGVLDGEGLVMTYVGEESGKIAVNGAVKGNHKYRILGGLIPEPLVVNDCKVVGQTSYNGQVVDGQGRVVGRTTPDKWAVDTAENKIGRVVRVGLVASPTGDYLGRTMPDSTVVDLNGVNMGCAKNDGSVVDANGNVIGHVVERGLVLDENGNPIGRVRHDGTVVDKNGKVIGKVLGDGKGTVVDNEGNVIGRVVTPDEELMFNEDGSIAGTFRRDGMFKDPKGVEQFQVLPNGDIIDPKTGRKIGTLTEDGRLLDINGNEVSDIRVLRDADGNFIGLVDDEGNIIDFDGNVIGKLLPDGTIVDANGNVIGRVNPDGTVSMNSSDYYVKDGKVYDKDGNLIGTVKDGFIYDENGNIIGHINPDGSVTLYGSLGGSNLKNLMPELAMGQGGAGAGAGGRRIYLGDRVLDVTAQGSLVDKDGNIIGYMGEDGRPYSLDNRLLVGGDKDGRVMPDIKGKTGITDEQRSAMDALLATRRQAMKAKINSYSRLMPDGRTLARAKKKEDLDWGEPKVVSTYPVDMSRMILKDKAIPAVLVHSIDSRYADVPVTAIVERHIYAEEGRRVIIPAGSRLIGTIGGEGDNSSKVAKVAISWNRLIRPDGSAFKFEGRSGDAQGRGGVAAYLDERLLAKYGKPVLSSTLTSAIAFISATNEDLTTKENGDVVQSSRTQAASDARTNFIDSMSEIFQRLLEESTNIEDVLFVPSGTRLTVFSNEDLWLRSEIEDEQEYDAAFGAQTKQIQGASKGNWMASYGNEMAGNAANAGVVVGGGSNDSGIYAEDDFYAPPIADGSATLYDGTAAAEVPATNPNTYVPPQQVGGAGGQVVQPIFPKQAVSQNLF